MATIVRLQALDGKWETVGVDRLRGIFPEGLQLSSNSHGSDTARFTLARGSGTVYPDLSAFTPCEIEVDGEMVWTGRVWETPTRTGSEKAISVEGRGWQYHLDDNPYQRPYVVGSAHQSLVDDRTLLGSDLNRYRTAPTVSSDAGGVVLGWGNGQNVENLTGVGVTYDLGPDYLLRSPEYYFELDWMGDATDVNFHIRTHETEDSYNAPIGYEELYVQALNSYARGTRRKFRLSGGRRRRYISVILSYGGGGGTWVSDQMVRIREFKIYDNYQYTTMSRHSNLRASDVVVDSVARAAPLLKTPLIKTNNFEDEVKGTPGLATYHRFSTTGLGSNYDYDLSGHGLDLDISGATYSLNQGAQLLGETDNSIRFTSGYAKVNDLTPILPRRQSTYEVIFKPNTLPVTNGCLVYVGDPATNGWGIYVGGNSVSSSTLYVLMGGVLWYQLAGPVTLTAGNIYHLIVSMSFDYNNHFALTTPTGAMLRWHLSSQTGSVSQNLIVPTAIPLEPAANAPMWVAGNTTHSSLDVTISELAYYTDYNGYPYSTQKNEISPMRDDHWNAAFKKSQWGSVQRSSFPIPDFPMEQRQTPREVIDASNAFHNWQWKVNHEPTVEFGPQPSAAEFEVGAWSGAEFEDTSANSGEEIYNEVVVEAKDHAGRPLRARVGGLQPSEDVGFMNPDFSAAGIPYWSVPSPAFPTASITRVTGSFHSSPASLALTSSSSTGYGGASTTNFWGTFKPGAQYAIHGWLQKPAAGAAAYATTITIENNDGELEYQELESYGTYGTQWFEFYLPFKFSNHIGLSFKILQFDSGAPSVCLRVDDFEIWSLEDESIPGRRGFTRTKVLPINAALTQEAADKIADAQFEYLRTTPFKGELTHTRPEGIRTALGAKPIQPSAMLNNTGKKIRFTQLPDPDTGAWGREGRIASVTWDEKTDVAAISIDSSRHDFEALLERLSAVIGIIR